MTKTIILFILAIAAQLLILAAVPAKQIHALKTGKTVRLYTAPVDPYSIMSGYYVTLGYEISRPGRTQANWWNDANGPTWQKWENSSNVYVVLEPDANGVHVAKSWHQQWPGDIGEKAVVIKGKTQHWQIEYGIESYYIPEDMRNTINHELQRLRNKITVEIKLDDQGNAALSKLIIDKKEYSY